jgi:hypothetical protein
MSSIDEVLAERGLSEAQVRELVADHEVLAVRR